MSATFEVPFLLRELPDDLLPDLLPDAFDEPLRLVDLLELERLRVDRLLEDFDVWAICLPSSWLPCRLRLFAPTVPLRVPHRSVFEPPVPGTARGLARARRDVEAGWKAEARARIPEEEEEDESEG
jgi:hypothetical protein